MHQVVSFCLVHSYVWIRAMTCSCVCLDSFMRVPWILHICAMTPSYVRHESLICVPWLTRMCATTHSYVCHDSFICVPCIMHMYDMAHWYSCRRLPFCPDFHPPPSLSFASYLSLALFSVSCSSSPSLLLSHPSLFPSLSLFLGHSLSRPIFAPPVSTHNAISFSWSFSHTRTTFPTRHTKPHKPYTLTHT